MLDVLQQSARSTRNDNGRFFDREFFFDCNVALGKIVRVDDADAIDAHRPTKRFEIDFAGGIALDVIARRGVLLMPRHAGDRIVENDDGRVRLIVSDIGEPRHARMHKGRVADHRHGL